MEILEAYDLVGTLRGAAALAGCDHKTVGHFVALREAAGGGAMRGGAPVGGRPAGGGAAGPRWGVRGVGRRAAFRGDRKGAPGHRRSGVGMRGAKRGVRRRAAPLRLDDREVWARRSAV